MKKYFAEFIGTTISLIFGIGTATLASSFVGTLGISLAYGLGFLAASCIINNISGCHINPAVSLAHFINKEMNIKDLVCYIIAQILGALLACFTVTCIVTSANIGSITKAGLDANGYAQLSSIGLSMGGAILTEIVLTFIFVLGTLKIVKDKKLANYSGILIALLLTVVHIIGTPLTGTSVNPARSIAPAILLSGEYLKQLWVFIGAPLIGATLAAFCDKFLLKDEK